jgi:hypothetical protein
MNLDPFLSDLLRSLLSTRSVAALATLHDGRPSASMVPFVATMHDGRLRFVIYVSGLAAHTRDMRSVPDVCLLITAPESPDVPPQALPRVSIVGRAEFIAGEHPDRPSLGHRDRARLGPLRGGVRPGDDALGRRARRCGQRFWSVTADGGGDHTR